MEFQKVMVTWLDSAGATRWGSLKEISVAKILKITTLGFLIGDHEDRIVVAASMDDKEEPDVADWTAIPKGTIVEIKKL